MFKNQFNSQFGNQFEIFGGDEISSQYSSQYSEQYSGGVVSTSGSAVQAGDGEVFTSGDGTGIEWSN